MFEKDFFNLFPTNVGLYERPDVRDHDSIEQQLKKIYEEQSQQFIDAEDDSLKNFVQTETGYHKFLPPRLNSFIKDCVYSYAKVSEYNVQYDDLYIADCWANYSKGKVATHTPHIHSNSMFSVVYYLSMPRGSGDLYFLHPNMQLNSLEPDPKSMSNANSSEFAISPREGQCVVFKSNTIHGTTANNINHGARINIAYTFNIKNLGKNSIMSHYEEQR